MKKNIFAIAACILLSAAVALAVKKNTSNTPKPQEMSPTATQPAANDIKVLMHTSMGDITLLLYGDTPKHMNNFVKLASEGYYDGLLFHRVISDFMVQGGDPDSRNAQPGKMLGMGDPSYQIDAEILWPRHYHKRGALAAARQGDQVNPERKSSGSQFYIVTGKTLSDAQLDAMERNMAQAAKQEIFDSLARENRDTIIALRRARDREGLALLQDSLVAKTEEIARQQSPVKFTDQMRRDYTTIGGTPHLDRAYSVFGEVLDGMDIVDKIQKAETDRNDRPVNDIKILSIEILDK